MKIKMPVIQTNTTATTTNNNNNSNNSNSSQSSNKKKKIMERNGFPGSRGPGIKKRSYQSDSIQNNKTKQKNKNKKKYILSPTSASIAVSTNQFLEIENLNAAKRNTMQHQQHQQKQGHFGLQQQRNTPQAGFNKIIELVCSQNLGTA